MEFKYTTSIYIQEDDLQEMVERVKDGESFSNVFYDIMAGYDDCDFYGCDFIEEDVAIYIHQLMLDED